MFPWVTLLAVMNAKLQHEAAAKKMEKERIARERIERSNRIANIKQTSVLQSSQPRILYESSPGRQYDSAPDILDMMNSANPLSPLFYPTQVPVYEPEPARECPAPSYEPDTSTQHDRCSSSSYDSGSSSSSYDSGSSSSCDSGSSSSSSFD